MEIWGNCKNLYKNLKQWKSNCPLQSLKTHLWPTTHISSQTMINSGLSIRFLTKAICQGWAGIKIIRWTYRRITWIEVSPGERKFLHKSITSDEDPLIHDEIAFFYFQNQIFRFITNSLKGFKLHYHNHALRAKMYSQSCCPWALRHERLLNWELFLLFGMQT